MCTVHCTVCQGYLQTLRKKVMNISTHAALYIASSCSPCKNMKIFWELSRNLSTCYPLILSVNFAFGGSLETHNNCLLTEVVPGSNPACLPMILGILGTLCYNLKANVVVRFLRQTQFILFSYIEVDRLTLLVPLNKGEKVFFERFVFYNYYYFLHKLHLSIHDRFLVFMFD